MSEDDKAQKAVEQGSERGSPAENPAAGPHAKDRLTDNEKTPGTGALPSNTSKDTDAGSE